MAYFSARVGSVAALIREVERRLPATPTSLHGQRW